MRLPASLALWGPSIELPTIAKDSHSHPIAIKKSKSKFSQQIRHILNFGFFSPKLAIGLDK
jgi:hypothetical protein